MACIPSNVPGRPVTEDKELLIASIPKAAALPSSRRRSLSPQERWVVAIGVLKLLKAVLFVLLGIGALRLLHADIVGVIEHFILAMRFDPEGHFVNLILEKAALIDNHRLRLISYAIFAYAGVDVIEGVGLVMRKLWAEFVTLILTASFLPWEFYEIARHANWIKVVLTLLNVAVVLYLFFYVKMRIRAHRRRHHA
jgi:uncharacterized membrane protein (DUF2068 family)